MNGEAAPWRAIEGVRGPGGMLLVADHASAHVPADIDLGIAPEVLGLHVAIDIGVAPLAEALCAATGCAAILATVSRLVCDFNRDEEAPGLLPTVSDGIAIPGNRLDAAGREARLARFFRPYHRAVADAIMRSQPALILSLHSFTPRLESRPEEARPWEIGILYNEDERAARVALPLLADRGIVAGDNQPYSGRSLNATMNRHAEARGIPYLGIEVRQDLIDDPAAVSAWAARLAPVILETWEALAVSGHDGAARLA